MARNPVLHRLSQFAAAWFGSFLVVPEKSVSGPEIYLGAPFDQPCAAESAPLSQRFARHPWT